MSINLIESDAHLARRHPEGIRCRCTRRTRRTRCSRCNRRTRASSALPGARRTSRLVTPRDAVAKRRRQRQAQRRLISLAVLRRDRPWPNPTNPDAITPLPGPATVPITALGLLTTIWMRRRTAGRYPQCATDCRRHAASARRHGFCPALQRVRLPGRAFRSAGERNRGAGHVALQAARSESLRHF